MHEDGTDVLKPWTATRLQSVLTNTSELERLMHTDVVALRRLFDAVDSLSKQKRSVSTYATLAHRLQTLVNDGDIDVVTLGAAAVTLHHCVERCLDVLQTTMNESTGAPKQKRARFAPVSTHALVVLKAWCEVARIAVRRADLPLGDQCAVLSERSKAATNALAIGNTELAALVQEEWARIAFDAHMAAARVAGSSASLYAAWQQHIDSGVHVALKTKHGSAAIVAALRLLCSTSPTVGADTLRHCLRLLCDSGAANRNALSIVLEQLASTHALHLLMHVDAIYKCALKVPVTVRKHLLSVLASCALLDTNDVECSARVAAIIAIFMTDSDATVRVKSIQLLGVERLCDVWLQSDSHAATLLRALASRLRDVRASARKQATQAIGGALLLLCTRATSTDERDDEETAGGGLFDVAMSALVDVLATDDAFGAEHSLLALDALNKVAHADAFKMLAYLPKVVAAVADRQSCASLMKAITDVLCVCVGAEHDVARQVTICRTLICQVGNDEQLVNTVSQLVSQCAVHLEAADAWLRDIVDSLACSDPLECADELLCLVAAIGAHCTDALPSVELGAELIALLSTLLDVSNEAGADYRLKASHALRAMQVCALSNSLTTCARVSPFVVASIEQLVEIGVGKRALALLLAIDASGSKSGAAGGVLTSQAINRLFAHIQTCCDNAEKDVTVATTQLSCVMDALADAATPTSREQCVAFFAAVREPLLELVERLCEPPLCNTSVHLLSLKLMAQMMRRCRGDYTLRPFLDMLDTRLLTVWRQHDECSDEHSIVSSLLCATLLASEALSTVQSHALRQRLTRHMEERLQRATRTQTRTLLYALLFRLLGSRCVQLNQCYRLVQSLDDSDAQVRALADSFFKQHIWAQQRRPSLIFQLLIAMLANNDYVNEKEQAESDDEAIVDTFDTLTVDDDGAVDDQRWRQLLPSLLAPLPDSARDTLTRLTLRLLVDAPPGTIAAHRRAPCRLLSALTPSVRQCKQIASELRENDNFRTQCRLDKSLQRALIAHCSRSKSTQAKECVQLLNAL